jgi:hypothetical protein
MNDENHQSLGEENQVSSFGRSNPELKSGELYQALLKADKSHSIAPIASGLAQEMNDLLTRIMGAVASLPKTETNHIAQAEEALLEAREVNRRLQHLTLASDGLKKEVKLQPIFDQVVNTAGAASVAKLEIAVQPNTGSVVCDPAELLQVLSNLVRNATEAMTPPPHNPTIQLTSELVHLSAGEIPSLAEGNYVKAEVRDNGCGISGDIIDKIWEPFFTTKKHASGLGLSSSLEIIQKLGGTVGVTSEVGVGSAFSVFIPCAKKEVTTQANAAPSVRFKTGRILVVDTDSQIRQVVSSMLEKLDYRSDGARDSEEALQQYKRYFEISRPYDAVLIDLNLEGVLGETLFKELSQYDPEIRAIAMSPKQDAQIVKNTIDLGFCGFLQKPFKLSELGGVLKTVLGS